MLQYEELKDYLARFLKEEYSFTPGEQMIKLAFRDMGNHKNEKTKEELFEFIKEIISKKDQKNDVDEDSDDD